ncbi:MAG TPA: FAD-linked oxidase C-terminal domain-containing protein [Polyangiaceae bacterium]|nr:FAD-linked oxidase C-terminal domain-containing protein [Polyangiaceae bacterium]
MTHDKERLIAELLDLFGDAVVTDPDVLLSYSHDPATQPPSIPPLAMVRVRETACVQKLAQWATLRRIPLVPRGAGTGLSGGVSAGEGSVIVNFDRMTRIVEIDEATMIAVVQPGVLNAELKEAVREKGLWYPPDPASYLTCTLGGNVATNAGGLCCVRYGVTRDYVLGLTAVRADGRVMRTGGRNRKDVAGYDLTRLLVGSEGTLAMITEITLRLRRLPPPSSTVFASFDSLEAAGRAVQAIVRCADPSLLELMDRTAIRAVEDFARLELNTDAAALLIAQADAKDHEELESMVAACEGAGAAQTIATRDPAEGDLLINARRLAFPALERLGAALIEDVAVPLAALAEMLRRIEVIAENSSSTIATVAHAGDGNLHPLILFERGNPQAEARARETFSLIMEQALALGGTITGEHGVGTLKAEFLERQLDPDLIELHRAIKRAFDPDWLLNPGKVISVPG